MLNKFFGGGPSDQTTPKATPHERNPFDLLPTGPSPSRKGSVASLAPGSGSRTPTSKNHPTSSYQLPPAGSQPSSSTSFFNLSSGAGDITPGPFTPGGKATTGAHPSLLLQTRVLRHLAS